MDFISVLVLIAYLLLLCFSLILLNQQYICDGENCNIYVRAGEKYPPGTDSYYAYILNNIGLDGVWPFALICASIITVLVIWLISADLTLQNFSILFIITFIVSYFIITFYNHHYIRPILASASNFITNNCDNGVDDELIAKNTESNVTFNNDDELDDLQICFNNISYAVDTF